MYSKKHKDRPKNGKYEDRNRKTQSRYVNIKPNSYCSKKQSLRMKIAEAALATLGTLGFV